MVKFTKILNKETVMSMISLAHWLKKPPIFPRYWFKLTDIESIVKKETLFWRKFQEEHIHSNCVKQGSEITFKLNWFEFSQTSSKQDHKENK